MSDRYAPIVLFVYDRLWHTQLTIEALVKNHGAIYSDLTVYSDGAKSEEDLINIISVRRYLKSINGFKSVTVVERDQNYGLARSIVAGVTEVCEKKGRIIVVEDDLVTSPYFLQYMNEALDLYENETSVGSIGGYWYPVINGLELPDTFLLRGTFCWGWATWSRAWKKFNADGKLLLKLLAASKESYVFDFDGSANFTRMLKLQVKGKNNSWAIRWAAAMFLDGSLQLTPSRSLVENIGFDGTGVHCRELNISQLRVSKRAINVEKINEIKESKKARESLIKYFNSMNNYNLFKRIIIYLIKKINYKYNII